MSLGAAPVAGAPLAATRSLTAAAAIVYRHLVGRVLGLAPVRYLCTVGDGPYRYAFELGASPRRYDLTVEGA